MTRDEPPAYALLPTPDGSRTAFNARYGEAYGSRHGAAAQARHVFVEGTGTHWHPAPRVLEIGFGVGVNFRATLADTAARGTALHYRAYEFDPAPREVLRAVAEGGQGAEHPAWAALLAAWPETGGAQGEVEVEAGGVRVTVTFADVLAADLPRDWATALYLDGFSPSRNPEVWTPDFVARLAGALAPGGVLGTYSAAGHVRRALAAAGLRAERRPGAPGKRECLRAVRDVESGAWEVEEGPL
ncbi:tRNA (5-methylaminomethyl-2-thiouridine)(34)-methyltransferase MnmD [Deinococcus multiflagellatus]|uniref:tRNA (5-methylaminomethyl-2-thiouridine)(34)-methyltransferase MnmD n=1 Tax=Deinococcus multiflagellatus TaxID=1656887 RepID=A0ABW1ZN81_9DEIO|nr:tRNA (5-methylaminomethyl-2-thiouridine)(34)-methyltransferase MnmD [Deinococcus multiflagellatus]MBZ9712669.1 tRNA (5-methylaminomethyl-2-thiouridine)(34)-methyltransferase MnmD [Deinococcus multiflagellatus]